jgi:hypothetical protein
MYYQIGLKKIIKEDIYFNTFQKQKNIKNTQPVMDITMKIKLRLRYLLLLFWLVQSLGAFADKGSKHPNEDKPDKPRKALGIPPAVLPNVLKLENATLKGVASNTASKAMMLQNVQLSNALDKAVAQMGDAMSLMDYSDMPAERVEAFVDASTNADRNEAQALFDEIAKGNRYIKAINKGADWASPFGTSPRYPLG